LLPIMAGQISTISSDTDSRVLSTTNDDVSRALPLSERTDALS